ncbi:MAG: hypothetical protein GTN96_07310, partial [Gammaproteobacteria bacterium]|nr:hypothetical protein [Gammaproteobacteria bacterium]
GDVETVVGKAMAKEPWRRYQSAAELAADIRRYLADEPIVARPASAFYQLRKFARRNKTLVGGVATAFVVLVAATVVLLRQLGVVSEARYIAERQTYLTAIAAADSAIRSHDPAAAQRLLDNADRRFRNWEWRYLT